MNKFPMLLHRLDKCWYSEKLTFEKEEYTHEKKNRGRNIIWHNPPFTENAKINIAKQFLHLLDKNFGRAVNSTRSSIITTSKLAIVPWII